MEAAERDKRVAALQADLVAAEETLYSLGHGEGRGGRGHGGHGQGRSGTGQQHEKMHLNLNAHDGHTAHPPSEARNTHSRDAHHNGDNHTGDNHKGLSSGNTTGTTGSTAGAYTRPHLSSI